MNNWHTEKFIINATNLDFNSIVPISEMIKMFQVATFNHSNLIQLDHKTMQEKSNAFWVITKLKVKVNKNVSSGDNLKVATWTQPLSTIRAIRDFKVKQKNTLIAK